MTRGSSRRRCGRTHILAHAEKNLKARSIGRGWKIKRADLETYVSKL